MDGLDMDHEYTTFETRRLIMRPHHPDDFAACAALWTEPRVVQYITGQPSTRSESWTRLLRYVGHWRVMGYGYWAVIDKSTGNYAGEVGFADFKREITPSIE